MTKLFSFVPALITVFACILAMSKGVDIYSAMVNGAKKGLHTLAAIMPAMLCLFPAVSFLRASGAADALGALVSPLLGALGVPPESALMLLIRPLSGSAAMGSAAELINSFGADSLIGSTQKMGAGTNVQTKLAALHHLDCPWRPSDVGRILRTFKIKKNVEVTDNGKDNF